MIIPFLAASLFAYSTVNDSIRTLKMHLPEDVVLEIISYIDNYHDLLSYAKVDKNIRSILAPLVSFKTKCFLKNNEIWPVLLLNPFIVHKYPDCANYIKTNIVKYFSKVTICSQPSKSTKIQYDDRLNQDSIAHTQYLLELLPSEIEVKLYLSNHVSLSMQMILNGETKNIVHLIIYKSDWDIRLSSMIAKLLNTPSSKIRELEINRPRLPESYFVQTEFNPVFAKLANSKLTSFSIHCDKNNLFWLDSNY
jgi:hypothetical protein